MCYNLAAQNRFLAALHERREIRCFYITGIFTSPLFLYNTSIFHFRDRHPNLSDGQLLYNSTNTIIHYLKQQNENHVITMNKNRKATGSSMKNSIFAFNNNIFAHGKGGKPY